MSSHYFIYLFENIFFSMQIICQTVCWVLCALSPSFICTPLAPLVPRGCRLANKAQQSSASNLLPQVYIRRCWLREESRQGILSTGLTNGNSPFPYIPAQGSPLFLPTLGIRISFSSLFSLHSLASHCWKCASCLPPPCQPRSSPFPSWPTSLWSNCVEISLTVTRRKKGVNPETVPPDSCRPPAAW